MLKPISKLTKKELLIVLGRLQRENDHLKTLHKLDEGIIQMMQGWIQFFKEMTCLTKQEYDSLVPMARFLERLSQCLILETKPDD